MSFCISQTLKSFVYIWVTVLWNEFAGPLLLHMWTGLSKLWRCLLLILRSKSVFSTFTFSSKSALWSFWTLISNKKCTKYTEIGQWMWSYWVGTTILKDPHIFSLTQTNNFPPLSFSTHPCGNWLKSTLFYTYYITDRQLQSETKIVLLIVNNAY